MKKFLNLALLLILSLHTTSANPLAIDGRRRPITMIAEKVDIRVEPGRSLVSGLYTFRQEKDDWPDQRDTHVIIYVPVIQRYKTKDRSFAVPILSAGARAFAPFVRNDLALEDEPSSGVKGLPNGWYMKIYEYDVPLSLLKPEFSIHVSYTQPHFPGDVVGYVPLEPPTKPGSGTITFHAAPGYALKPFQARAFFNPAFPTLTVTPKDHELIRVKCVRDKTTKP